MRRRSTRITESHCHRYTDTQIQITRNQVRIQIHKSQNTKFYNKSQIHKIYNKSQMMLCAATQNPMNGSESQIHRACLGCGITLQSQSWATQRVGSGCWECSIMTATTAAPQEYLDSLASGLWILQLNSDVVMAWERSLSGASNTVR